MYGDRGEGLMGAATSASACSWLSVLWALSSVELASSGWGWGCGGGGGG